MRACVCEMLRERRDAADVAIICGLIYKSRETRFTAFGKEIPFELNDF